MSFPRIRSMVSDRRTFLRQSADALIAFLYEKMFMPHPPNFRFECSATGHRFMIPGEKIAESINQVGVRKGPGESNSLLDLRIAFEDEDLRLEPKLENAIRILSLVDDALNDIDNDHVFNAVLTCWKSSLKSAE